MTKWLITGGAGFIGSHVVEQLVRRGDSVRVLDMLLHGDKTSADIRGDVELVHVDVRDPSAVENAVKGCDAVIHLAAYIGVEFVASHAAATMEVETLGTLNVLNAMRKHDVSHIVYASTSAVYGHHHVDEPVAENFAVAPVSGYAIAKRSNEIFLKANYKDYGISSASIRFFNVYGPRQDERMVIPRFFRQALRHEPITVFGSGSQTRDFTYIEDTADIIVDLGDLGQGCHIVNIARGAEVSVRDLAFHIVNLVQGDSQVVFMEPPVGRLDFEVSRRWGSSDKLFDLIGKRPKIDVAKGLNKYFDWMRDHPQA